MLKCLLLICQYVAINKIVVTPEGCEKMKPRESAVFFCSDCARVGDGIFAIAKTRRASEAQFNSTTSPEGC